MQNGGESAISAFGKSADTVQKSSKIAKKFNGQTISWFDKNRNIPGKACSKWLSVVCICFVYFCLYSIENEMFSFLAELHRVKRERAKMKSTSKVFPLILFVCLLNLRLFFFFFCFYVFTVRRKRIGCMRWFRKSPRTRPQLMHCWSRVKYWKLKSVLTNICATSWWLS